MITLTRKLARQVHDVFRRGLPKTVHGERPRVVLQTDQDGLRIRAWSHAFAIEYLEPGNLSAEQITIPLDALKRCAGSRPEPVTLDEGETTQVVMRWNDLGIPQVVEFEPSKCEGEYPVLPQRMQKAGENFLAALRDASETADAESIRYACNCVRLCGKTGRIDATDTRQALIQSGFKFGWSDDVLIPASPVFNSAVFRRDAEVRIGRTENWVALQLASWTIQLAIDKERRFPDVDGVMPAPSTQTTRLRLSEADARFLERSLSRLPQAEMTDGGVTVDLNGAVAIRARSQRDTLPTELVLVGSQRLGEPICVNTDRKYLARAIRLGFREVAFASAEAPAVCGDGRRRYAWAVLSPDGMTPSAENAVRIESSARRQSGPTQPSPEGRRPKVDAAPAARRRSKRSSTQSIELPNHSPAPLSSVEQLRVLQTGLRSALRQTRELAADLRRQRKASRLKRSQVPLGRPDRISAE